MGIVKIVREMMGFWDKRKDVVCDVCQNAIHWKDARYRCKECDYDVCTLCASKLGKTKLQPHQAGVDLLRAALFAVPTGLDRVPPPSVEIGDLILAGPTKWGIHHVVVVRGPLIPAPDQNSWV